MRKKLAIVSGMLVLVLCVSLVGCGADSAPTDEDSEEQVTATETMQPAEEDVDESSASTEGPTPVATIEPSGHWSVNQGVTGGPTISDATTHEELEFEEIAPIYRFLGLEEDGNFFGDAAVPTSLHVTLADGTEGDIDDADVIDDLSGRIIRMRVSPDLVATDPGTFMSNELSFYWDDGHRLTFIFKGHTALAANGMLYPILESDLSSGEIFVGGMVVGRPKNPYYPDAVFDIARMMIEDGLGKRAVIKVKSGTNSFNYTEDTFQWDDGAGDWGIPTYTVKAVRKTSDSPGGICIMKDRKDGPSCVIEGATRLYVIEMLRDDEGGTYLQVTYQPEDTEDEAQCTIRMENGELVVSYL